MIPSIVLRPAESGYPTRLHRLRAPPDLVEVAGRVDDARTVAIVGTRSPRAEAREFAENLAAAVCAAGGVVLSGGARGIDAAAHRAALRVGGRTWCVAPTGRSACYPAEHAPLFEDIASSGGAMIWPFPPETQPHLARFHRRNEVLAALADVLVIVQAGPGSGALSAARYARLLQTPLWVVAAAPWSEGFEGSLSELERGARALTSVRFFLKSVELPLSPQATFPWESVASPSLGTSPIAPPTRALDAVERRVAEVLSHQTRHKDEIALQAGISVAEATSALLMLTLEQIAAEGPAGHFRRKQ